MDGIELKFGNLTNEEARQLLIAHADIKAGNFRDTDDSETAASPTPGVQHQQGPGFQPPVYNPTPQPNGQTVEVDAAGIAWNEAIHSGSKKKNGNGSWAVRKNLAAHLAEAYRADFAARLKGGANTTPPAAAHPTPAQLNQQFQAPPVNTMPPPPMHPAPAISYEVWYAKFIGLYHAQKITEEFQNFMNQQAGVTDTNAYGDPKNETARQVSYGLMTQLELA